MKTARAFTLIELLLVVTLVGVLTGALVSVINITRTKDRAKDAVRLASLEKVIQGIEAFYTIENKYPAQGTTADHNPLDASAADSAALSTYLKFWPGDSTDTYFYYFIDTNNYVVGVNKSTTDVNGSRPYYKYHPSWEEIQICTSLAANNLCPGASPVNDE